MITFLICFSTKANNYGVTCVISNRVCFQGVSILSHYFLEEKSFDFFVLYICIYIYIYMYMKMEIPDVTVTYEKLKRDF